MLLNRIDEEYTTISSSRLSSDSGYKKVLKKNDEYISFSEEKYI